MTLRYVDRCAPHACAYLCKINRMVTESFVRHTMCRARGHTGMYKKPWQKKGKKLATPRVPTWSPTAVLTGPDEV